MTAPETLVELAERCEAATGPGRELDKVIALALGWSPVPNPTNAGGLVARWYRPDGSMTGQVDALPSFTASLDAAMSLVPEGMQWFKERGAYVPNIAVIQGPTCSFVGETDSSFALALCAAALRARDAQ